MDTLFILTAGQHITVSDDYQGYVVMYKKHTDAALAAKQETLLQKLIENGLKLNLSNFLLVDLNTAPMRFSVLNKQLAIKKCILMGITEKEIGLNMTLRPYQLTEISGIQFIKCDSPEKLDDNNTLKSALWKQLQHAFNLI
jgi:hypothetical protein